MTLARTVIFACVHNAGRSQMAAGFFNMLADPAKAWAISAGTSPAERVHPEVVTAMQEVGVDLCEVKPRLLTPELAAGARRLVTMGCGDACPFVPGLSPEDWALEDPKDQPPARVRAIPDEIRQRVGQLIAAEGWQRGGGRPLLLTRPNGGHAMIHSDPPDASPEVLRLIVRERYGDRATTCRGPDPAVVAHTVGYREEDLTTAPEGANLGLGCGNPIALASLRPGETVLDLGSGAGFDAFLAAAAVGPDGRVIGIDMTPEMIAKAVDNARRAGVTNVEFRQGLIEELPVENATVDVVISNCVINLSPEKPRVFREAFRVLRPGGRLLVSDIVLEAPLPEAVQASIEAYVGCVAGAALRADYLRMISEAGFDEVTIVRATEATALLAGVDCTDPMVGAILAAVGGIEEMRRLAQSVASVAVSARKPPE
jgi:arsenite methyltransferase